MVSFLFLFLFLLFSYSYSYSFLFVSFLFLFFSSLLQSTPFHSIPARIRPNSIPTRDLMYLIYMGVCVFVCVCVIDGVWAFCACVLLMGKVRCGG